MEIRTNTPFRPVKCLEEQVQTLAPVEGYVLFTTDTRKIYACVDGEYKMMGGSSGVFYGNKYLTDEEKYGDQVIFYFLHTDIDGNSLPAIDDLILNIPDGGFYRVLEVTDTDIQTQRLAISGGGSGGGGGTGGGPSNEGSLVINYVKETPKDSSTITGVDYYIQYEVVAKDSAGDLVTEEGTATWIINGKNYYQKVVNGKNSFKVDEYLDPSLDKNKLVLMVTMNTGGVNDTTVSKTWYVKAVDLKLEWDWNYTETNYVKGDTFTFAFTPYGGVDCVAHVVFDEIYNEGETYFTTNIPSYNTGREVYTTPMKALDYGSHKCEMYLTTIVNGLEYRTPSIFNEITFIKDDMTSTILTVPYYGKTATQYDTLNIPFMVYDPDQEKVDVSFYVNDIRVGGDSYDRGLQHWPYTLTEYGSIKLTIMSDNEEARHDIELVINKLDLNVTEPSGYKFSLKANNFSSNTEIQDWEQNGVSLEFSDNFDWKNGGLKTETLADGSIQKYILVRQGTRMTIDYKPFRASNSIANAGLDFKFCFKAINCYDYEAPVMDCYDESSLIGIKMDAQKAYFAAAATNLNTQYYENSYVELEAEIWPTDTGGKGTYPDNPGDRFLMFWVDGVPVGIKDYKLGSEYFSQTNEKKIVIGSDLADVCIYLVKVYERKLTENEHLDAFILDAPNSNEMMRRYVRNDIVDNSGEISYEKLVQKNPNCHAYVYRIPKMTTSKDDKVGGCEYFELFGENNTINNPYYKAIKNSKGARIRVQGTSSAAYGVAAFNLRTEFQEGLLDKDGNQVDGWKVSETSIPIDYVCTKVNVASCENANNVVNAEWYNKYQPYHDGHRRKVREDGNLYRDCMEFNSGVVFVLDENKETDWHDDKGAPSRADYLNANVFCETYNYTNKPYYKMYSIGNMGNDKKNSEVFHDVENPKACCVEVTDNQNAEHHMTVPTDMSTFELEDLFYEFRYPDGNDKASTEMKQGWVDFVNWMAASNPRGGNDEHILTAEMVTLTATTYVPNTYYIYNVADNVYTIATGEFNASTVYYKIVPAAEGTPVSVVFEPYTFKGYEPPGYEGKANPTGVSLKGTTIRTYSTTKVTEVPIIGEDGEPVVDENGVPQFEEVYTSVPYTHDTFDYRMAKMLAECEEHLVMDSVMFHYLYIQRHTMVDNVAKNTFWSSEDCKHWDLTKNYDNDTSDGNNNSGYLTYTYGIEPYDMELDDKGVPANIFNASDSVWLAFTHNLYDAQKALYKALWSDNGAWSAKPYLAEFEKHQNVIPERCWIYDYFRKYIRPRRLGLDQDTYLKRLEGGKKIHQRTQYETYQEFYIDSKYIAGTSFNQSTSIDMRLNYNPTLGWNKENTIPLSFYIDCYSSSLIGGRENFSGERIKRGEIYEIPVGAMLSNPNDATCYIYGGRMVQTLSGLAAIYPSYAVLTEAKKLRRLELGSNEEGYYNARLATLSLEGNEMLQQVYVQNAGKTEGFDVDLTNAVQLKDLKLNGSTAKVLKLAPGTIIEILHLNGVTDFFMEGATSLTDIQVDNNIYTNLRYIEVKNSPAFDEYSYNIALRAPVQQYVFGQFVWNITENPEDHFVIENGKVIGLKVLDKLLAALPKLGYTTATALDGKIVIDVDCNVDEYQIYAKYSKQYPNLVIEYTDKVSGLDPAVELVFKSGETDASTTHYRVLGSGTADGVSIGVLISADGPTGTAITNPNKGNTSSNTYTFTGYWKDSAGNKYYVDGLENPVAGAKNFNTVIPTSDMTFYPEFLEEVRKHELKFYDYEGNVILQNGKETFGVPFGSTYKASGGPLTNFYYLDSADLPEDKRYGFRGWTTSRFSVDEGKNVEYFDLENDVVKKAMNLYPYYETESVYEAASSSEYFVVSGNTISIKEEYRTTLKGKITLPEIDGVSVVGDFKNMPEITHVYFLRGSKNYTSYARESFRNHKKLVKVDTPTSITKIGVNAFSSSSDDGGGELIDVNLHDKITDIGEGAFEYCSKLQVNELPENLETLGANAFRSCGKGLIVTTIPKMLTVLSDFCFVFCPNVKISVFGSKDGSTSRLYTIGNQCLYSAGNGMDGQQVSSITIYDSVQDIRSAAFEQYAYNSLKSVYFTRPDTDYELSITQMGFSNSVDYTFGYTENSV